jgi:hypothetical protein
MQAIFALIITALAGGTLAGSYCQLLRDILRQTPESFGINKDLPVEVRQQLLSQWDESTRMSRVSHPLHWRHRGCCMGGFVQILPLEAYHHYTTRSQHCTRRCQRHDTMSASVPVFVPDIV